VDAAAGDREQAEARRARLERVRLYAARSASPFWAWLGRVTWVYGAGVAMIVALPLSGRWSWTTALASSLVLGLIPLALLVVSWRDAPRSYAREEAWAKSLPFPPERYLLYLGYFEDHPRLRTRSALVFVELADAARLDEAADACRGFDPSLKVRRVRDTLEISAEVLLNDGSNHRFLRWMHRLVDQVLGPLAAHHPIARVSVGKPDSEFCDSVE
jgi:hypothetical protein